MDSHLIYDVDVDSTEIDYKHPILVGAELTMANCDSFTLSSSKWGNCLGIHSPNFSYSVSYNKNSTELRIMQTEFTGHGFFVKSELFFHSVHTENRKIKNMWRLLWLVASSLV